MNMIREITTFVFADLVIKYFDDDTIGIPIY